MRLNRKGVTRIVIEFKKVVVKIPNFTYSWENFLSGILANIRERDLWKYNSGVYENFDQSKWLCPVLWGSIGGWIIVMKKVDRVLTSEESELSYNHECIPFFGGDDKPENYGFIADRIVKIDYGNVNH